MDRRACAEPIITEEGLLGHSQGGRKRETPCDSSRVSSVPEPRHLFIGFHACVEIRRQFREFGPDVVVGFGILNAFLGIWIARRHGAPFVHYVIDELYRLMPRRLLQGLSKLVERADYRRATMVLSINEALR